MITVFENANIFNGSSADLLEGHVVVEDQIIREITATRPRFPDSNIIDCAGRFLMPGLIDAHFHTYTPTFDILRNDSMPPSLLTSHGVKILAGALRRGFTTVRDAAGRHRPAACD